MTSASDASIREQAPVLRNPRPSACQGLQRPLIWLQKAKLWLASIGLDRVVFGVLCDPAWDTNRCPIACLVLRADHAPVSGHVYEMQQAKGPQFYGSLG